MFLYGKIKVLQYDNNILFLKLFIKQTTFDIDIKVVSDLLSDIFFFWSPSSTSFFLITLLMMYKQILTFYWMNSLINRHNERTTKQNQKTRVNRSKCSTLLRLLFMLMSVLNLPNSLTMLS